MMKIWLSAVMIILVIIVVDITVIGWDRFVSGIGALVDGYWHVKQVSPNTAQSRTTPPRLEPAPQAPVRDLTPEDKQRPESSMAVETTESVRSSSNFVVMPGKLVGNFSLGMTWEAILKIAPKPQETFPDRLVYKSRKTGNSLVMHLQNNKMVQIDFTSKDFYTGEGIHTGNFWDEQYAPFFNVWVLPGTFPSYKFTWKTDGLTFYSLNVGSSNPNYPAQAVGAIHIGQQPPYEVQKIAGQENGGWIRWDKGLTSTKQPAEVKTSRPPTQPLPGALPWPGEQVSPDTAATTAFAQQQQPYFPLQRNTTWTYRLPATVDPAINSKTVKVVHVNVAENTYTVEYIIRLGTLPHTKNFLIYEVRGGNVLEMGRAGGFTPNYYYIPARIVLRANLTKGMHWKEGPKDALRDCEVLDFVTVKVAAGEYKNVAKIRVKEIYSDPQTNKEQLVATHIEYYAPKVGLVRHDVLNDKDGHPTVAFELVTFALGVP